MISFRRSEFEYVSDVRIGESPDHHVLPTEQVTEDLSFITRERIESFCPSFWSYLLKRLRSRSARGNKHLGSEKSTEFHQGRPLRTLLRQQEAISLRRSGFRVNPFNDPLERGFKYIPTTTSYVGKPIQELFRWIRVFVSSCLLCLCVPNHKDTKCATATPA